ncbi:MULTISPECIES: ankyrin repeat domain-containing protein [Wolbachia]|uniref:ankyrin repeat domain-containing protein n=1 Tax=Wolbachia TaxID=953 RepID=UPI002022647C|nr:MULTISPECIES: ankyrin repeat domain-containing protein [unclassified Wolbachia]URG40374.1 ankyrin repeat domain-containing protein [Wolbachia endosymbiont of Ostrinia furnacalis]URG40615.1 ankyrin repeat domain-containing protein [Wolbachia endosymbiont of Ostrinia scapulalis]
MINELFAAVRSGDANQVADLINKGDDVNARDNRGNTPLHLAVLADKLQVVEKLIEGGADVNAKNNHGATPLHWAALNQNVNILEKLIEKGANVNEKNKYDNVPLHYAAGYGSLSVIEKLIEGGADVNAKNNNGDTLLHLATKNSHLDVLEKLIKEGANVNERNKYGNIPLHWAASYGRLSIVEELIEGGADVNAKNNNGNTPLHWAVKSSHLEVAKFLISNHADVNAKNKDGWTSLHFAAAYGNLNIVKLILDKSDYVDARGALAVANTLNEEDSLEIRNLLEGRIRRNEEITQHLNLQEESSFLSTRVHNRRSIVKEDENSLQNDKIGPNKIGVTSGTSKPSSFINIFAYTTVDTMKGIFQFVSSPFKAAISMEPSKAITVQGIDNNGILLLLDVFIRKITGQKYISTVVQSISQLEAQGYALNIIEEFEKVVEQAALKSGISIHRLNIDCVEMQKEVTAKITGGKFNEISGFLNSYVEQACHDRETGKLSPKKFNKFMIVFNKELDLIVNQSMQQILHNRDSTLEVEEQQINLEPQSYLSNTSVQGHLIQDRGLINQGKA